MTDNDCAYPETLKVLDTGMESITELGINIDFLQPVVALVSLMELETGNDLCSLM